MVNPFFKNNGPFKILELLKILNIKNNCIDLNIEINDINDLLNSKKNEITFFHSKKYKNLANKTMASFCLTFENLNFWPKNFSHTKRLINTESF